MHLARPVRLFVVAGFCGIAAWTAAAQFDPAAETLSIEDTPLAALRQGEHYRIEEAVVNDGRYNRYTIVSDYGTFEAESDAMARIRVAEVAALARLDALRKTMAFAGGARESALKRWRAVKSLFTHPVRTLKRLPRGTARYVGNYYRMAQGGRGELEEPAAQELVRFSAAKRGVAAYVGADPYSSNPVLQEELNETAWAAYGGGLMLEGAFFFVPSSEFTTVFEATTTAVGMSRTLESESPESLRAVNKRKLKDMGLDAGLVRRFLKHEWYSPRHETILVESLRRLDGVADRGAFLELALGADSEQDALLYQQAAEMLAAYHERVGRLSGLAVLGGWPAARTAEGDGHLLALPLDRLRWTEEVATQADAVARERGPVVDGTPPLQVWLAGKASETAAQALADSGATVVEKAAERLQAPQDSAIAPKAEEGS